MAESALDRIPEFLQRISVLLASESARQELRQQIEALPRTSLHVTHADDFARFILEFVTAGVEATDILVDIVQRREEEVPLITSLAEYWLEEEDAIPDATGILGLVDDAYLSLRVMQRTLYPGKDHDVQRRVAAALSFVEGCLGPELTRTLRSRLDDHASQILSVVHVHPQLWHAVGASGIPPTSVDLSDVAAMGAKLRPMAAASVDIPDVPAPPKKPEGRQYDVWFGTNREPVDPADISKGFLNERSKNDAVHHGVCTVDVPKSHGWGSLGTPFWKRWIKLKFKDDNLRLRAIRSFASREAFLASLREELASQSDDSRCVLIYLHGFNVPFDEAARRAAQIGVDLKVPGVTAFYSWPSKASPHHYGADLANIEASERQIAEFIASITTTAGADKVHVIAHSMGNRGLARAMQRITQMAGAAGVRFGQIILAAPDLDVDLFRDLAAIYPTVSQRTTMYVSSDDWALKASAFLQASKRAGLTSVSLVDGIDTIEVSAIDLSLLGHGYYAEAEPVLYDIKALIESNTPPHRRVRLQEGSDPGCWAIGK